MLFFMPLMKVFTVQTYFQGNKADSCTLSFSSPFSSSPHLWFPLGSRHLAFLLSEVVIYKHQFVSIQTRGWLFSASLTIQLVQIKTMCVTLCGCVCVFLSSEVVVISSVAVTVFSNEGEKWFCSKLTSQHLTYLPGSWLCAY